MEEPRRKPVSLLGPVLLIGIGTVLLLNTLGILDWSIWWTLLRLWPVFLIAAGLELLLGRHSVWGSLLAVVLVVIVAAGALWLSVADVSIGRDLPAKEIHQPLGEATRAEVSIEPGVGILRIEALPESAYLVEGVIHLGKGEEVVQDFSEVGGKATFELRTEGAPQPVSLGGWDDRRVWDLGLSPGAALALRTGLGLGDATLDLSGLALSDLEATMGLGVTKVILPAQGPYRARIDGAMGGTTIIIPEDLAARIQVSTGFASSQLPPGYREHGDGVYTSPGYDVAGDGVDLEVSQAMGILRVRHPE